MKEECLESFKALKKCLNSMDFLRLPGLEAQLRMAPAHRHLEIQSRGVGRNAIKSSVLILLYPSESGEAMVVFILRPEYDGAHSGQISFPGGRHETDDPDMEYTALRETYEEIGVGPEQVEVMGRLTDLFIPPSNFLVCPYVGVTNQRPLFKPDPLEVAAIIEVDLRSFFRLENCLKKTLTFTDGTQIKTPCFSINGHVIWGATAMMLSEFLSMFQSSE